MKESGTVFNKIKSGHLFDFIIPALIICIGLARCNKEEDPSINITNLQSIEQMYQRDTLIIEYSVNGNGLDSVCLFIDDKIWDTQIFPKKQFNFIPVGEGSLAIQLKLGAYFKSGLMKFSDVYSVNISNLITPPLYFSVTRFDDLPIFFVGEKLKITISSYPGAFSEFSQMKVFMNNDSLGIKTLPPFIFFSNEILFSKNTINVELKDRQNRIHHVKYDIDIPVNTPPTVNYYF